MAVVGFDGNQVYANLDVQKIEDGELETDDHATNRKISDVSKIVAIGFAGTDQLTVLVHSSLFAVWCFPPTL